ncbi:protein kinase family protein [Exiguobacterium sp. SH3S2]|uniref:protein kinase family protein n=1 Tax=unclassified Exiguobacterium TaxID=2644629 RepID=UPI00103F1249|nr:MULTISPECIES: protein kinase family protein [unclassified Exiguobacterium]TCI26309.1 protein kinase family protein [Exiguobacterium sp. SH5S4]TCI43182.1 protein kinase family protein [Exiguobacterium sp. SH3S3]TCI54295.1 protein kinase family protein [Exiguobacterium sp. SH5S13]TCI58953.1 protein kinase family protein [Exiguobacterium sp. SH3S2]TCI64147.1 protein kinase family protein [Exiguobacterium sp. SH3S1]
MNCYEIYADVSFEQDVHETRVTAYHQDLELHGIGRSAAVFRVKDTRLVIKVFFPGYTQIAAEEAVIYRTLEGLPQFPHLYEVGPNYIVIDYIEGKTLFECLTEGIWIDAAYIEQVDEALIKARQLGLTPSDVHLRNIILSPQGRIYLIDLARFRQGQHIDHQWEDLKRMYRLYRLRFVPKRYSERLLNGIAYLYRTFVNDPRR